MKLLEIIVDIYLTISLLTGIRIIWCAKKRIKQAGVKVNLLPFLSLLLVDVLFWPYYVVWFGLKAFFQDLR
jgi:hypothetical protein